MNTKTHLSHLYSLLFTLLLTNQTQSRTLKQCSSSCGDITINYPFRLNTDPSFCGDSGYELSCQNNKTLLEFHSGKYYVKLISYDRRIIRLVDVNLAGANCSLPYGSLSVEDLIDDGRYQGRVANTYTSFVRCEGEIGEAAYRKVDCLSRNGSYVYVTYDNYIISGLQGPCTFISRVPTIFQAVLNPSYQSIVLLLQEGFELSWSVECRDCIEAGYSCTVKSWDPPYEYECYSYGAGFYNFYIPAEISLVFYAIWDFLFGVNLVARFILAPIVLIGFLIHKYRTTKETVGNNQDVVISQCSLTPSQFSYADIVAMTDQFKDKLGQGGFGVVYKGQLPDGSSVAVKMVGDSKLSDEEFVQELRIIGGINHGNVIRLLGFCCEGSYRALIFEHMPNGSLDKYMNPKSAEIGIEPFSWEKLLQVSVGTAQGINHLHEGSDLCIIHFDIKPQNVLLDQNFVPKVSDFSLQKFYPDLSISAIKGTRGYIAPELISSNLGAASCKSDVYSFGMLLLKIVEGRWKVDNGGKITGDLYFPSWLYDHLIERGNLMLENITENESAIATKLSVVGLWCIQKIASDRPSMTKVVEMLEGSIADLQLPPNSLSFPQYTTHTDPLSDSSTELLISETVEKSS